MQYSKNNSFRFFPLDEKTLEDYCQNRLGETRIGQTIARFQGDKVKYVILGIEESVGPMANLGLRGSENAFDAFMRFFLNMQSHEQFSGENIHILGRIRDVSHTDSISEAKIKVAELDDFVQQVLSENVGENQVVIVIGGGHNNALPLMKFSGEGKKLHVVNIDPHADCRATDGRHSGNSFSMALENNWIERYTVLGLHEAYNNTFIRDFLQNNKCMHTFYEEYLLGKRNLFTDLEAIFDFADDELFGVEIDMDAIAGMPSSAFSPSGWRLDEMRTFCMKLAPYKDRIAYLHLPEAAPQTDVEKKIVGKSLSYLVRDFLRDE